MAAFLRSIRCSALPRSKSPSRAVIVGATIALLVGACTGSSAGEIAETPTPSQTAIVESETPTAAVPAEDTPTPTPEPTPEPEPVALTDDERIAAAIAEFDSNPQPEGLFAYDILDTSLSGNGVIISLCAWTGETVFDEVRQATYRVSTQLDATGEPDVTFESTTATPGDCLNTTLVESALQATRDYDTFWGAVLDDPTTFDREEAANYLTESKIAGNSDLASRWSADEAHWRGSPFDASLPESSLQPILWRRYPVESAQLDLLELVACRELKADYGLYQGDLLIDDERGENAIGIHAVDLYQLVRSPEGWLIGGTEGLGWSECINTDWLDGVTQWQPGPTDWEPIR